MSDAHGLTAFRSWRRFSGVAFGNGHVYIADPENRRIVRVRTL